MVKINGVCVNCHCWFMRWVNQEERELLMAAGPFVDLINWTLRILCRDCGYRYEKRHDYDH